MTERKRLYRISELERLTAVPRRRIHFYIQSGLLHKPLKTGKTMAYYDDSHRTRLLEIKAARDRGEPLFSLREERSSPPGKGEAAPDLPPAEAPTKTFPGPRSEEPVRKAPRRNSELTRERILVAGCNMFRQHGYRNTKVNDLTRELNIGKGTFYFYFSDKKELFLECVPRLFEEMFAQGWDEIRQIYNPVQRLERRFELVLQGLREFCAILQLAREAMEEPDPKLQRLGNRIIRSISSPVESDIDKGIKRGIFYPVDVPMAASLMIAAVESLSYLPALSPDYALDSSKMHMFNLLVYGLAGKGERLFPEEPPLA